MEKLLALLMREKLLLKKLLKDSKELLHIDYREDYELLNQTLDTRSSQQEKIYELHLEIEEMKKSFPNNDKVTASVRDNDLILNDIISLENGISEKLKEFQLEVKEEIQNIDTGSKALNGYRKINVSRPNLIKTV